MAIANNCRYPDCIQCDRNDCDMDDKDIQAMLKRRRWDKNPEVFREKQREYRKRRYQWQNADMVGLCGAVHKIDGSHYCDRVYVGFGSRSNFVWRIYSW